MAKIDKALPKSTRKTAARKETTGRKADTPRVRTGESILDDLDRMRDRIMERAYEIFSHRGRHSGRALEDWLEAEQELAVRPPIELRQDGKALTLEAAIPGFEPGELDVRITPEDILIQSDQNRSAVQDGTVHEREIPHGKVFRDVRLPARVDPAGTKAEYRNGVLRVTAPIAGVSKPKRVRIART